MKLLIADDNPRRYQRLMPALAKVGVDDGEVDFVTSANDARDKLDQREYDLLLLDILIPLRGVDEADQRHSLDLITEIRNGGLANVPRQIVGITADDLTANSVGQIFNDYLWTLIRFRQDADDWIQQIVNCVTFLQQRSTEAKPVVHLVDIAVICALASPELEAFLQRDWTWQPPRPIDETTFVHDGIIQGAHGSLTVIACAAPRMGMVSTALLAAKVIERTRPKLLVMGGICAGVAGKTAIGDVLLADPSWDWQSGKRSRDHGNSQFAAAPHQLPAPASIRAHVQQLALDATTMERIASAWKEARPGQARLRVGPVASGSAVLADGDAIQEIKSQQRELLGVEMEAYGLYAASHFASAPRPLAFALKAVCDFADEGKNDDYQAYAACMSACVIEELLAQYGHSLLSINR